MRIVWESDVLEDLAHLRRHIGQDNPAAAVRVASSIRQAVRGLKDNPRIGRAGRVLDTRELVVTKTPYLVAYRVMGNRLIILRVLHGAQQWPESL